MTAPSRDIAPGYGPPRVGVAVLARRSDGRFLIGLRKGAHAPGTWGLPGGKLDPGERSFASCAAGEALEETGLELTGFRFLSATNDLFDDGQHWVTVFVQARVPDGAEPEVCEPGKCERWEWTTPEQALALPLMLPLRTFLTEHGLPPQDDQDAP